MRNFYFNVYGITGISGAGKSSLLKILEEKGAKIFSADEAVNKLLKKSFVIKKIQEIFPSAVEKGEIQRKILAKEVFSSYENWKRINSLLHPLVEEEANKWYEKECLSGKHIGFLEAPLLFEAGWEKKFPGIILVYAEEEEAYKRASKRLNIPYEEVQKRMRYLISQEEKLLLCDYVIYNISDFLFFEKQVEYLWKKLL